MSEKDIRFTNHTESDQKIGHSLKNEFVFNDKDDKSQMNLYLKQVTHALSKERQASIEKSDREKLLWKIIERINSSFDQEQILQSTVDELGFYFKVNRCGIIIPQHGDGNKDLVREYADGEWRRSKDVYEQVTYSVLYRSVLKSQKPLVINDTLTHEITAGHLNENLRSILMVPLIFGDNELLGVIYLHQCKQQRAWTNLELSLIQSIANPLAIAIEKTKLFSRTKAWAFREKLLNRLTARIRGTLNIKVILERTVAELGQSLQSSRCFINIIDKKTSREIIAHEYTSTCIRPIGIGKENPLIINKFLEKESEFVAIKDLFKESRLVKLNQSEIDRLYSFEARAMLAVPISFQTKLFGWLCFHQCNSSRNWSNEEISFIQSVASQVGVAINQAEMFEELSEYKSRISRELKQAEQLQSILLRSGSDIKKNLHIAVAYQPHHSVSGDFYWINELTPHKIGILIGDVSGKGPAAALLTGFIIGEIKGLIENKNSSWFPEKFLTELGDSIYEQNQSSDFYATAWYGIFDLADNTLTCCNAGHPSPFLMRGNNIVRIDDEPGVPLGLLSCKEGVGAYTKKVFKLNPKDQMVIFTDGFTEQRKLDGSFLPESWMTDALSDHAQVKFKDLPDYMISRLNLASDAASADDDRLMVAIEMPESQSIEFYDENQEKIELAVKNIIDKVSEVGLPKMFVDSLRLGLIEAIYNGIRHGLNQAQDKQGKFVKLLWTVREGRFSCTIKDPGPGFDWKNKVKTQSELDEVDLLSEGGRGIPLYYKIFTEVKWNPKGNELGLILKW